MYFKKPGMLNKNHGKTWNFLEGLILNQQSEKSSCENIYYPDDKRLLVDLIKTKTKKQERQNKNGI